MAQPYVGEIRMVGFSFAPVGWMLCQGQTLPISENEVLFQLIGTTYGGDGESTFQLPNLQSRVPIHQGKSPAAPTTYAMGEAGGVESVTLSVQQIPTHAHALLGTLNQGTQNPPGNALLAQLATQNSFAYGTDVPPGTLVNTAITPTGGNQPHENLQPYLCINYIISLFGIFPSQT